VELEAGKVAVGAKEQAAKAGAERDKARADVRFAATNILTGAQEFVSDNIADAFLAEGAAVATIQGQKASTGLAVTQAGQAQDNIVATGYQRVVDILLNTEIGEIQTALSQFFQMPAAGSLMAPATSQANALALSMTSSSPDPKEGFSGSVFGTGGGTTCIGLHCLIKTESGWLPLRDVTLGMMVIGGDDELHKVINWDKGWAPVEHRTDMLQVLVEYGPYGWRAVILTSDHLIGGARAEDIQVGQELRTIDGRWSKVAGVYRVPYRPSGDLLLEGCNTYNVNGVVVDSMIATYPSKAQQEMLEHAQNKERGELCHA